MRDDNQGMLVLSRKRGERIFLNADGEQIELTLVEIRGDKVRLGFKAGPAVKIMREEVLQKLAVQPIQTAWGKVD